MKLPQAVGLALLAAGLPVFAALAQGPALDPAFAIVSATSTPNPTYPRVVDMVRQPDGKLIVVGDLSTVNNVPVNNVCRLLPNGQVDTTFSAASANRDIISIALQADGKLLIAGRFTAVDGQPRKGLARLLANGALDAGFVSPYVGTPTSGATIFKVVVQPNAGILVMGTLLPPGSPGPGVGLARLLEATGAMDPTFQPGFNTFSLQDVLVLPNGRLVVAGRPQLFGSQQCNVWGALANGALDPAFVPLPGTVDAYGLVPDPATGNLYVTGAVPGTALDREPVRLRPNGTRDFTFSTAGAFVVGPLRGHLDHLAVQPNGRLLLGGDFTFSSNTYVGSWRLLPSGARDPSYQALNGPNFAAARVLVQPDGALVFGGSFNEVGGFALNCVARMLDPNVLAVGGQQTEERLATWPVPAHDVLHLRLAATGGGPVRLALLDALGRVVRQQDAAAGQTALALPTAGLPPGTYLLRVAYPSGPVLRRVAVE